MEKINQINKYQSNFSSALNLYFEQMNKLEHEEINFTEDQIYKKIKLRKIIDLGKKREKINKIRVEAQKVYEEAKDVEEILNE
jgi:hypothetical protein